MAATKTAKTLRAAAALAAGAAASITEWNLSTAYGGLLGIKLTNGATAPTTAPQVAVYVGEATGVKRLLYSAAGDTVNSSVTDIMIEIPASAMFVNATISNGATNGITAEAYGQELTGV